MTKKIIISLAVIVAIVSGILYGKGLLSVHQGLEPPPSLAALKLEKTPKLAPAVMFTDAAGSRHALDAFRGRYVLVNLWATWCGPCVNELPALARLATFAPGLKVVPINMDTTK
jgi:thiol-disulfide isomerase/thioredoxin